MHRRLEVIAHDIRSRENVGALFRMADSLGVACLWLTGYTVAPPDEKLSKVALGAEKTVPFIQEAAMDRVFAELSEKRIPVYALELTSDAVELAQFTPPPEMALLLGTERGGVAPSLLEKCAGVIKIHQSGQKESMNVAMATAIACWQILHGNPCTMETGSIKR